MTPDFDPPNQQWIRFIDIRTYPLLIRPERICTIILNTGEIRGKHRNSIAENIVLI